MTLFDLILIAVSLSMDAFAVSICKGLSVRKVSLQHAMICGVWFGGFQFLMPALGYFLGDRFAALLTKFGPWIAFVLLALIGANMIKESFGGDEQLDDDYSAKAMLPLAIATSIDAFAVGVSFAAMQVDILPAAGLIGVITCLLSAIGVKVGAMFGDRYRAPAERIGGIVLILIGVKTLDMESAPTAWGRCSSSPRKRLGCRKLTGRRCAVPATLQDKQKRSGRYGTFSIPPGASFIIVGFSAASAVRSHPHPRSGCPLPCGRRR